MSIKSAALELLVEKLDPIGACQYGITIVVDVIEAIEDKCPKVCIDLCDKIIETFVGIKDDIYKSHADQLKECKETGECASHREGHVGHVEKVVEKRVFIVGPDGESIEMSGEEALARLKEALRDAMAVRVDDDGNVERGSLPEDMPEELKDRLCSDLPRMAKMIQQLKDCKTDEERSALLELLRMGDAVRH